MSEWVKPREKTRKRSAYQQFMGECLRKDGGMKGLDTEARREKFHGCVVDWKKLKAQSAMR